MNRGQIEGSLAKRTWSSNHPANLVEYGIRILELDPLRSMFYSALLLQQHRQPLGGPVGAYYEFGVGEGNSLVSYSRALNSLAKTTSIDVRKFQIFAFDTFEGLPTSKDSRDVHPGWWPGGFRSSQVEIKRRVDRALPKQFRPGLHYIKGRYEESLTPSLREQVQRYPPAIINIDCDYYTSTRTALNWVFPMLRTGSIIYFDDIWEFWGHPDYGEMAAMREFCRLNKGQLLELSQVTCPRWGRVFVYVDGQLSPGSG
jgi:Methyltransferase domain